MVSPKKLPDNDLNALRSLITCCEAFQAIRPTMPLQYVVTFLLVAMEEGLSVNEYAKRAGVSMSVMSRHLLDIGERNRHMEKGFGLITQRQSPLELRRNEYYLTTKGKALLHQITRQLKK